MANIQRKSLITSLVVLGALFTSIAYVGLEHAEALFPEKDYQKPATSLEAVEAPTKTFVRQNNDNDSNPKSLDVAIARYQPVDGSDLVVDLVGAVHFAEESYYDELNKRFASYDAVLYELVGPKNSKPTQDEDAEVSSLGAFQLFMADMLGLEHQLLGVDYQSENFVHADASIGDLVLAAQKRGDTKYTILTGILHDFAKMLAKAELNKGSNKNQPQSLAEMLALMNKPVEMKKVFAESLASGESLDFFGGQSTLGYYIVDTRNDIALRELDSEISKGKKRIAIFYGAAHLPDFEEKLLKDYGLKRTSLEWLPAWDLEQSHRAPKNELLRFMQLLGKFN